MSKKRRILELTGTVTTDIQISVRIDPDCKLSDEEILSAMKQQKLSSSILPRDIICVEEEFAGLELGQKIGTVCYVDFEDLNIDKLNVAN